MDKAKVLLYGFKLFLVTDFTKLSFLNLIKFRKNYFLSISSEKKKIKTKKAKKNILSALLRIGYKNGELLSCR